MTSFQRERILPD